jgi:transcriptional regulator with XRE-family HTH domain
MSSLGQRLRETREQQGGSLSLIAAQLRIGARYLEAIEDDKVELLPGGFFARSFYRQYAEHLGIDPAEIQADIDRLMGGEATPLLPGQGPRKEGSDLPPLPSYAGRRGHNRKILSAVAALVLVVAACATVYRYLLTGERAPTLTGVETVEAPAVETNPAQPGADVMAAVDQALSSEDSDGPMSLEIEADEEVWVDITVGGERVFRGLLRRNETKQLTGVEEARLLVGNAGGVRIYWNGNPVGRIGSRGQVRVVKLTPDGTQVTDPRQAPPTQDDGAAPSSRS